MPGFYTGKQAGKNLYLLLAKFSGCAINSLFFSARDQGMSDDDIEDQDQDQELDGLNDPNVDDTSEDEVDEPVVKPRKKAAAEDPLDGLSVEAKARERERLEQQIAEFMARGGRVQEIDSNVVSDPPKKPDSKYGSRPI